MKQKIISIAAALALCLCLLPSAALAVDETPTGVAISDTLLSAGKYVVTEGAVVKATGEIEDGTPYLEYRDGALTVCGRMDLSGKAMVVFSDLSITGDGNSGLVVQAVYLKNSRLTLDGAVDLTAVTLAAVGNETVHRFETSSEYSGDIAIQDGIHDVALNVRNSASVAITGTATYSQMPPNDAMTLESQGNISFTGATLQYHTAVLEGKNVSFINSDESHSYYIPYMGNSLTIRAEEDVTFESAGSAILGKAGPQGTPAKYSIDISAGGDVTISSGDVPIQNNAGEGSSLTVRGAQSVSITGETNYSGKAVLETPVVKFENCGEVTVANTDEGGLLKEGVTVTSDHPWTVRKNEGAPVTMPDGSWTGGGDVGEKYNSRIDTAEAPTVYTAGDGCIFYEPPAMSETPGKLTLDNASFEGPILLTEAVSIVARGENRFLGIMTEKPVTVETKNGGTLNTIVTQYDDQNSKETHTVYGKVEYSGITFTVGSDGTTTGILTISEGAELTIPKGKSLTITDTTCLTNNGALVNHGTAYLKEAAAEDPNVAEAIKSLGLTGGGTVTVITEDEDGDEVTTTYTNSGTKMMDPAGDEDGKLDLSSQTDNVTDKMDTQGYKWEVTKDSEGNVTSRTLTLAEGFNVETLTLPYTGAISIVTQGEAHVKTLAFGGGSPNVQLTFSEKGPLIFQNLVNISGGDNNSLTVEAGAEVVANGGISIGASGGVNSTVTVNGKLTANGGSGTAIYAGKVSVGDTGVLEVSGKYGVALNGMPRLDAERYKELFTVTGGGRFTADCTDYNVQVAPSGSFPEGTTAKGAIPLTDEYLPDDCEARLSDGGRAINLVHQDGTVYSGPLTIHKNHTWETGWTWDGTNHWHACEFAGCTEKQPGSEAAHFYRSCVCTVCSYRAPAGTPDSNSGGGGGGGSVHTHVWETEWTTSETHHWHECTAGGCDITVDSDKDGYGAHVYDSDQDAECNTCGYRRTVTPPIPSQPSQPSGGGSSVSTTYAITVEKSEHGKVTSSRTNASSGSTVTLTVTPDGGYVLETLTVTDSRGGEIRLTAQGGGKYAFTMPGRAVTVKAAFSPLPDDGTKPCDGGADCPSRAFPDLDTGSWYHEAVDYVLRSGLMNGYGDGLFGPNDMLTRAQFAQVLFNKEGRPEVNYLLQYSDAAAGAWYAGAIRWATSQGIVCGYGNGQFGPDDPITREQLAVMLWRYAGSPAATDKELHFNDADEISGWALEALRWAVEKGIISGKGGGILDPSGQATRAETAQMLKNFLESM